MIAIYFLMVWQWKLAIRFLQQAILTHSNSPGLFRIAESLLPRGVLFLITGVWNCCFQQNAYPIKCPNGTFGPHTGRKLVSECIKCTEGYYCEPEGLDKEVGLPSTSANVYRIKVDENLDELCSAIVVIHLKCLFKICAGQAPFWGQADMSTLDTAPGKPQYGFQFHLEILKVSAHE